MSPVADGSSDYVEVTVTQKISNCSYDVYTLDSAKYVFYSIVLPFFSWL
jgi:hypothetical protein